VDELPALIDVGFAVNVTTVFGVWPLKAEQPVRTDSMSTGRLRDRIRLIDGCKDSFSKVKLLGSARIAVPAEPGDERPDFRK
jgi:hypothetical protein